MLYSLYLFLLFSLWVSYWSFSWLVLYRLKNKLPWIFLGRSFCPKCNHQLSAKNLVPVFSYLFQKGKCSYCSEKIPLQYFLLEISLWIIFVLFGLFVDTQYNFLSIFLYSLVFLGIYILSVYDYLHTLVEDEITLPLVAFISSILLYQDYSWQNLISLYNLNNLTWILSTSLVSSLLSVWVLSLLYYAIFSKYHWLYILLAILAWVVNFFSFWASYLLFGSLWALVFFVFFYIQIVITNWKWIGWGDLRFWLILWLLYWLFTLQGIFWTYILSMLIIPFVILKNRKFRWLEIPFWPILFITYFILLCYYR